jgi:hypothetical protein
MAVIKPGTARLLDPIEVDAVRDSVFAWFDRQREALGPLVPASEQELEEPTGSAGAQASPDANEVGLDVPALDEGVAETD